MNVMITGIRMIGMERISFVGIDESENNNNTIIKNETIKPRDKICAPIYVMVSSNFSYFSQYILLSIINLFISISI